MYFILCDTCLYITNSYVTLACALLIVKQFTVNLKRYVSEVGQLCPHLTKIFGKLDNQFPKSLDDQLRKEYPVTFLHFAPKRNYNFTSFFYFLLSTFYFLLFTFCFLISFFIFSLFTCLPFLFFTLYFILFPFCFLHLHFTFCSLLFSI